VRYVARVKGRLFLLAAAVTLAACSEDKPKAVDPKRVMQVNGVWLLDGKPWTGKQSSVYPDGKPSFEGELIEGKPHGTWTWYYESGNPRSRVVYSLGMHDGNETHYYDDAANTPMWIKVWRDGRFVESHQWKADGTPVLPRTAPGTNTATSAVP
tara:strand:- start:47589 stop:48050 length:462 start_codon:yes stop_codon:yes gene_type:complete